MNYDAISKMGVAENFLRIRGLQTTGKKTSYWQEYLEKAKMV